MDFTTAVLKKFDEGKTAYQIASELNTYLNKVLRILRKYDKNPKDNVKGKPSLTAEQKQNISKGMAKHWSKLSPEKREEISQNARLKWENLSDDTKQKILRMANEGLREAAKNGSKLELYLVTELQKEGYEVLFHKKMRLGNERMHLDLYLPKLNTAIEIDGPLHYYPLNGKEKFEKVVKADIEKNGLLNSYHIRLIRVKNLVKTLSQHNERKALREILFILKEIEQGTNKYLFEVIVGNGKKQRVF